jgi:hypothetical protein
MTVVAGSACNLDRFLETSTRRFMFVPLQGRSLEGGHELLIINHAIIHRLKRNLASAYLGRCEDTWVTGTSGKKYSYPSNRP